MGKNWEHVKKLTCQVPNLSEIQSISRPSPFKLFPTFRGIVADKMDIRGGYAKPNWKDILWVQLFLLPLTAVRSVFFIVSLVQCPSISDPDVTGSVSQDLDAESGTTNVKNGPRKKGRVGSSSWLFPELRCSWWKAKNKYPTFVFYPVLWIRDVLIRIRGSVPVTYGSGSCFFVSSLFLIWYIYIGFHR
jgi:hypothetical protein